VYSLYATGLQAYTGIGAAWLIYWLGDATGALLVTPLVFTCRTLVRLRPNRRINEFIVLVALLIAASFLVFGDLFPIRPHVLAFAVLPLVMWAAINFGVGGASLSVLVIATLATLLTAFGKGPFAESTPFVNAALLDVLFMVLSVTGLALASVIVERERAVTDREKLIRAQAAMETRLRLAAIVESSNDAVLSMTFDGVIDSWNAAARRIFGYAEGEALGQPVTILIPPELHDEFRGRLRRLQSGERIAPFETSHLTHARERRQVAVTMSPITDGQGVLVGAAQIIRDVTEERRVQEALSSVNRRLIEAQEVERRRLARELHDDIGQRLAQLAMNIAGITDSDRAAPPVQTRRAALERQVSEIAADVQALSHRLHSSRLELLGITGAMRHFCTEFAEQHKATIDVAFEEVPAEIPSEVSLCMFRVLQEGLHNAMKHSGVRVFDVQLRGGAGQLHLLVRDQGAGFDVDGARIRRGLGLLSMEERIRLVNGQLAIESVPGGGTSIHARVPISG
jgi:PAS domain S-box-containing protein